jgi:hypothetical protein
MNQRIFELIQDINGRVGVQWDDEDKEEFAQLIVKECLKIMDDEDDYAIECSARMAAYRVKKHFGVEE